MNLQSQIK